MPEVGVELCGLNRLALANGVTHSTQLRKTCPKVYLNILSKPVFVGILEFSLD